LFVLGRTEMGGFIDRYLKKEIDIDSFVTHTMKLQDINKVNKTNSNI
jgi:S-(hydroxymethyl)glutathione dehydrogenase/alcohol dehydrogenase